MSGAPSLIGISITTKDRWDDVEITLSRLQKEGLDSLETIVVDDGSAVAMPSRFGGQFPWVKFLRFESSQGISSQRNRVIQLLSTPLVLQLDDDSFPIAGDLEAAASWLLEHPKVCSLAFRIVYDEEPANSPPVNTPPFPVLAFIGCGTLIKRELFLALGGYEERFGHSSEEGEYCIKAFQQGYETYAFPAVVVRHRVTTAGRNRPQRVLQIVRNYMLTCLWYYPFPVSYLRAIRFAPMQIMKGAYELRYCKAALIGWVLGLVCYLSWPNQKRRLSWQQFQKRDSMPAPDAI